MKMKRVYANAFKHYDRVVYCQTIEGGHFKDLLRSEGVNYTELPVLDQDIIYYKKDLKKEVYALIKSGECEDDESVSELDTLSAHKRKEQNQWKKSQKER